MLISDFTSAQTAGPPNPNAYKRAVYRSAPVSFCVEMLTPTKHGSNYSYGMRISNLSSDTRSTRTGGSHTEYDIWRRWEDCLWFQDTLELEYSIRSREKRQRLVAGKGIKKNGIYIHDQAASFESLPPGPDPGSIAKDVHDCLPRLTKKGTLFRASQATIEQRDKEFCALIDALFKEDVPTLIKELRECRVVRDFFGYWRRDRDLAAKVKEKDAPKSPRASVSLSPSSLYFSASTLSLQFPPAVVDYPPSVTVPKPVAKSSLSRTMSPRDETKNAVAGPSKGALLGRPSPAPLVTFNLPNKSSSSSDLSSLESTSTKSQPRSPGGFKSPSSSRDRLNVAHEAPVTVSPRAGKSPDFPVDEQSSGLQSLPEEMELSEPLSNMRIAEEPEFPAARRRARTISAQDRTNRNGVLFMTVPPSPTPISQISERHDQIVEEPRSSGSALGLSGVPLSIDEGTELIVPDNGLSANTSSSSQRSSMAFSSSPSVRSSWRTSISELPPRPASSQGSSYTRASCIDLDLPFTRSPVVLHTPLAQDSYRTSIASFSSMRTDCSADAVIPRRPRSPPSASSSALRRSLSAGARHSRRFSNTPSVLEEEQSWPEGHEDLLDSYLYTSGPSQETLSSNVPVDETGSEPSTPGPSTPGPSGREQISTHLSHPDSFPKAFQHRPAGQFHIPWSPRTSMYDPSPNPVDDSIAVKAVLRQTIIVLRTARMTSLSQVRHKLADKFLKQEEILLSETFALGYLPPSVVDRARFAAGRARSSSSAGVSDTTRLRYIKSQEEWDHAVATCAGKLTLRVIE